MREPSPAEIEPIEGPCQNTVSVACIACVEHAFALTQFPPMNGAHRLLLADGVAVGLALPA